MRLEVTDRVERIEATERKFGIRLEALYAVFEKTDYDTSVTVNFDIVGDGALEQAIDVVVGAYNEQGQLVATSSHLLNDDSFEGLDSASVDLDCETPLARIRLYPKRF